MRIENSHGILRDCFQQSIIQLAQAFEPKIKVAQIFTQFATRLGQSLALREDLKRLVGSVRQFEKSRTDDAARRMKDQASHFYDHSLRYLMYRDWAGFETFCTEVLKCQSLTGLVQIAHRFETYLRTLLQEISKRSVLQEETEREQHDALP
ncbi:MAG: hypothetical protein ACE5JI_15285, partial [Acidobacteriota bacterium]